MKPIPNYPGYFAHEDGTIWSLRPFKRSKQPRTEPVQIQPSPNPNGYLMVNLQRDRKKIRNAIHTLILTTFDRPQPEGMVARHGPNGKGDNSINNLSWGTPTQNCLDRVRDGTMLRGESHPRSKWTAAEIRKMRTLHANGVSAKEIAKLFDSSHSNVCLIIKRKAWAHIS